MMLPVGYSKRLQPVTVSPEKARISILVAPLISMRSIVRVRLLFVRGVASAAEVQLFCAILYVSG